MHFRTAWDPYVKPTMSVLDTYHFAIQHFDPHRRQPTPVGRGLDAGQGG